MIKNSVQSRYKPANLLLIRMGDEDESYAAHVHPPIRPSSEALLGLA